MREALDFIAMFMMLIIMRMTGLAALSMQKGLGRAIVHPKW